MSGRIRAAVRRGFRISLALVWLLLPAGILAAAPSDFRASPWPEADQIFRRDPFWVGGDGAYSIALGEGRTLWLFGDSIIDPSGLHSRKSAGVKMIANSIAIQNGSNPATATMQFYWKADGSPAAFFPDSGKDRFWPGHGVRIRDRLLLFLMKVRTTKSGLGFEVCDWKAVLVSNPDDDPPDWKMSWIETPSNKLHAIVGSAGVFCDGDFVYAYASQEPGGKKTYLVRWPENNALDGDLSGALWWDGKEWTGKEPAEDNLSAVVLQNAGSEFTVHRDAQTGKFLQIQSRGFGPADLTMRMADQPAGPWSNAALLYHPPEFEKPRIMIYQGKAHPELTGAGLVLTYSTNSFDFGSLMNDEEIYYPRFVRLERPAE
ncbi:MAG: DUF4185 domain-containing protein [Verrucomicrobiaceae bacterium]|nr:MAG: DUF4185 domain-containing protein [Verrucomicrobiaceae bacterium]